MNDAVASVEENKSRGPRYKNGRRNRNPRNNNYNNNASNNNK